MSVLNEEIYKVLADLVTCLFFAHMKRSKNMIMTGELYQVRESYKLKVERMKDEG